MNSWRLEHAFRCVNSMTFWEWKHIKFIRYTKGMKYSKYGWHKLLLYNLLLSPVVLLVVIFQLAIKTNLTNNSGILYFIITPRTRWQLAFRLSQRKPIVWWKKKRRKTTPLSSNIKTNSKWSHWQKRTERRSANNNFLYLVIFLFSSSSWSEYFPN